MQNYINYTYNYIAINFHSRQFSEKEKKGAQATLYNFDVI